MLKTNHTIVFTETTSSYSYRLSKPYLSTLAYEININCVFQYLKLLNTLSVVIYVLIYHGTSNYTMTTVTAHLVYQSIPVSSQYNSLH